MSERAEASPLDFVQNVHCILRSFLVIMYNQVSQSFETTGSDSPYVLILSAKELLFYTKTQLALFFLPCKVSTRPLDLAEYIELGVFVHIFLSV